MNTSDEKILHSHPMQQENRLFPVFLKLENLRVLIVGGGKVALEKLNTVLANSPQTRVTLVAPDICQEILNIASKNHSIEVRQRNFLPEDLNDVDLVIAATDSYPTNKKIKEQCQERKILINVADTPDLCDFYLGSIVSKGDLKIAVSTNGKSPTLARRMKEILNEAIPDEIQHSLDHLEVIRKKLNGSFSEKVKKLNEITSVLALENEIHSLRPHLIEEKQGKPKYKQIKYWLIYSLSALALMITGHLLFSHIRITDYGTYVIESVKQVDKTFLIFVAGGFLAQLVDGALGMAYGVTATTFLLSFGLSPAAAIASVKTSEIFTTGASGISHLRFKNVNTRLFRNLLLPGVLGAILGAYILSSLQHFNFYIRPLVAAYTFFLGMIIIIKAIRKIRKRKRVKRIWGLALAGGLLDSIGGGGWGPIVSSTLIARGKNWRYTIGSVNLAEFFITLASSATFFSLIGIHHGWVIAGLITGGIMAAPLAAYLTSKIHVRGGLILVGVVVIIVSIRIIYTSLF
jgi:siroheme synthase-like protein